MRTPTTGRGLHPQVTTDTARLWPLDDTAIGATSQDIVGGGALTFAGGATDPALGTGNIGNALVFSIGDYVQGPTGDDAILRGEYAFDAWVYMPVGSSGPVATYSTFPASELEPDNTLFELYIAPAGTVTCRWETGAGTDIINQTTAKIPFEQWCHLAVVVVDNLGFRDALVFINGDLVEAFTNKTAPTGGANSRWWLGRNEAGLDFDGKISSVRFTNGILSSAEILSAFRRGMAWEPEIFENRLRVVVTQGGPGALEIDLTDFRGRDWVESVEISDTIDAANRTATIRFGRDVFNNESLAPLMLNSPANKADAGGGPRPSDPGPDDLDQLPAIALWHNVTIEAARVPMEVDSVPASDYQPIFYGRIDSIDWPGDSVVISCRDEIATLTDKFITSQNSQYGAAAPGRAMELVIQDILTAEAPGTTLRVPVAPSFGIVTYTQQAQPIIDALRAMADLIGWALRWRWSEDNGGFFLTLYDPGRDRLSVDAVFDADDYSDISKMGFDLSSVRNVVRVSYKDDEGVLRPPITRTATDVDPTSTSVADYGERWMSLAEKATEHINTAAEAIDFADIVLRDLMEPEVQQSVTLRGFWELSVGDRVRFEPNGIHYSAALYGAVMNVSHAFKDGRCTTTVALRGRTASAQRRHLEKEAGRGSGIYIPPGSLENVSTSLGDRARLIPTQVQIEQGLVAPVGSTAEDTPNPYFSVHVGGDTQCFDGWRQGTGSSWGNGLDVFWDTVNHETGDRSMTLLTAGATVEAFLLQPVMAGRCQRITVRWMGTVPADNLIASALFYDQDRVLIATTAVINQTAATPGSFETATGTAATPAAARFAAIRMEQGAAIPGVITIDRVHMTPQPTAFSAYSTAAQTGILAGTIEQCVLSDTAPDAYDYCGDFDAATSSWTVPDSGFYVLTGKVTVQGALSVKIDNGEAFLYKNGASWLGVSSVAVSGGGSRDHIELHWRIPIQYLLQGDKIDMRARVNVDDFDILSGADHTWMSGALMQWRMV